jgi:hypothetical protein
MTKRLAILALLLAAVASSGSRAAPASPPPLPAGPAVVVDYSMSSDSYRVTGDAVLLSQRFTPGTSLDLLIAAAALESGELTAVMEVPTRDGPMNLAQALKDSNEEFFAQVLKRVGYEPVRRLLQMTRYTPGIPEAVASFAELARGEPLRVTVFEQNLFLQSFVKREVPIAAEHCEDLERDLVVSGSKPAWGQSGWGEISADGLRYVSWLNGAARFKDGTHVITVAALTSKPSPAALERFRDYLAAKR